MADKLRALVDQAFDAVCEAEQFAYPAGLRSTVGADLIQAHSALLRARNELARKDSERDPVAA